MALNIPWDLFGKLFRNDISEFERQELNAWSDASELNRNIYIEIINDQCIKHVILAGTWENNALEWQNLLSRIKPPKARLTFTYNTLYLVASVAAVVLILAGVFATLLYERSNMPQDKTGYTYIFSPRGQRTQVILPDQTKVWLNSESSLRYPVTYNQKIREVYIEGEAFFEVEKNLKKPFYVQTKNIKVKVYGTTFNIKAFPDDNYIETTLIEGKLSIMPMENSKPTGQEIFLKPKEKLIYEKNVAGVKNISKAPISSSTAFKKDSAQLSKKDINQNAEFVFEKDINPEKEMLWKDGKLIFYNETFGELAVKLERWYDVKIHFENEDIQQYRFTGMFDKETINQAMDALKISSEYSFNYKITFRDIYLKSVAK